MTLLLKGKELLLKPDIYYLTLYFLLVAFLIPILFLFIELDKNSLKENLVVNVAEITFTGFILCLSMFVSLLDQFGSNDNYGHQAGDDCLVQVSNTLSSCVVQSSGTLARFGGDEFIILLTDIDKEHIAEYAEQIRKEVERSAINIYSDNNSAKFLNTAGSLRQKHITVSLGICTVIMERREERFAFLTFQTDR